MVKNRFAENIQDIKYLESVLKQILELNQNALYRLKIE